MALFEQLYVGPVDSFGRPEDRALASAASMSVERKYACPRDNNSTTMIETIVHHSVPKHQNFTISKRVGEKMSSIWNLVNGDNYDDNKSNANDDKGYNNCNDDYNGHDDDKGNDDNDDDMMMMIKIIIKMTMGIR